MKKLTSTSTFIIILAFCSLFIISCEKNRSTVIEGHVYEFGTNDPVEGATIYLQRGSRSGGWSSQANYVNLDSVKSDALGYYKMDHFLEEIGGTVIEVEMEGYINKSTANFQQHKVTQHDFVLQPYAWIQWHVENVNPYNSLDLIVYSSSRGGGGSNDQVTGGQNVDVWDMDKTISGNHEVKVQWTVRKNGIETTYSDSIFTAAHATSFYEILY